MEEVEKRNQILAKEKKESEEKVEALSKANDSFAAQVDTLAKEKKESEEKVEALSKAN